MTTPITTADLEVTLGLTKRQVLADVRAGLLPGYVRPEGGQYVCPPGEFAKWQAGEWEPDRERALYVEFLESRAEFLTWLDEKRKTLALKLVHRKSA